MLVKEDPGSFAEPGMNCTQVSFLPVGLGIYNKPRDTCSCVHVGILVFCVVTSDSTSESKVLKGSSVRQWVAA